MKEEEDMKLIQHREAPWEWNISVFVFLCLSICGRIIFHVIRSPADVLCMTTGMTTGMMTDGERHRRRCTQTDRQHEPQTNNCQTQQMLRQTHSEPYKHGQAKWQNGDVWTLTQTYRRTYLQTYRKTKGQQTKQQTKGHTCRQIDRPADRQTDRFIDSPMDVATSLAPLRR